MHFVRRFAPITNLLAAVMPGIEKLPIEETLEDSPQVTAVFPVGFSWYANVSHLHGQANSLCRLSVCQQLAKRCQVQAAC